MSATGLMLFLLSASSVPLFCPSAFAHALSFAPRMGGRDASPPFLSREKTKKQRSRRETTERRDRKQKKEVEERKQDEERRQRSRRVEET